MNSDRRPSAARRRPDGNPPLSPALALFVSVLAFSWAGPLVRFTDAPALAVALWRLVLAVGVLVAIISLRREGLAPLWRLKRESWFMGGLAGVFLALHFWSWIASIQFTSVASSVVLVSTQPLFVALLSALVLGERPVSREWAGMVLAVLGAAWIGWGNLSLGGSALFGDGLALTAALLAAAYYVVGRSLRSEVDILTYVVVVYGSAAVVLFLAVLMLPEVDLASGYTGQDWLVFLGLALGPMLLGHTGVNYALRYIRAYKANLAVLGEPLGATLLAWILPAIAERPSWSTVSGGGIILLGIGIALYRPEGSARGRSTAVRRS